MLHLFHKPRPRNSILNLFRITDMSYARAFDWKELLQTVTKMIASATGAEPTGYSANLSNKAWSSWDGFVRCVQRYRVLTHAYFSYERDGLVCKYSNSLVGFTDPPLIGSISLMISSPEALMSQEHLLHMAEDIFAILPFEYGYAHALEDDWIPGLEKRIRRTFFGSSVEVRKEDSAWLYHMIGIQHGYMRSVYPFNILNPSQARNPAVVDLLANGIGKLSPLKGDLVLWTIPEAEVPVALRALAASGSIIWHEWGQEEFLKNPLARRFYESMWPK